MLRLPFSSAIERPFVGPHKGLLEEGRILRGGNAGAVMRRHVVRQIVTQVNESASEHSCRREAAERRCPDRRESPARCGRHAREIGKAGGHESVFQSWVRMGNGRRQQ